ncbi:MAG: hypothetical protein EXR01_08455 [Acetobacteraceae bacterium]|nr:hypothetical protein [Acetobacteraceae bacterium]
MTVMATADVARATRRRGESNGSTYWITSFLGANRHTLAADAPVPGEDEIYPMAFLVEQDASTVVQPHFHQADQFQVVVDGAARLGTHDVEGVAVHFTNRFSAYGPIAASKKGVHYFTLRNGFDPGAKYMPGARMELRTRRVEPHREAVVEPSPRAAPGELALAVAVVCTEVMPMAADGLGAWRYCLPPGAALTGPDPTRGRGQIWLVLSGEGTQGAAKFGTFSCLFVYPDEAALALTAGADGTEILCMQYPRR